jgi:hypothetical protein
MSDINNQELPNRTDATALDPDSWSAKGWNTLTGEPVDVSIARIERTEDRYVVTITTNNTPA